MALRNIVLMVKDAPKTAKFFSEALGLQAVHQSHDTIELQRGSAYTAATVRGNQVDTTSIASTSSPQEGVGPPILVMQAPNAASLTAGYTPILNFDVEDMDISITNALTMGATLDGPIKYPAYGKVAAIRSPDGHMIGLFEPSNL